LASVGDPKWRMLDVTTTTSQRTRKPTGQAATAKKAADLAKNAAVARAARAFKAVPYRPPHVSDSDDDPTVSDRSRAAYRPRGPPRLITKHELLDRVPITYPLVWQMMRDGKFPRSRQVGGRSLWVESEIEAWIAGLPIRQLKGDEETAA
jgi:predicted DNA-binding transcriptional regulator AlpA